MIHPDKRGHTSFDTLTNAQERHLFTKNQKDFNEL